MNFYQKTQKKERNSYNCFYFSNKNVHLTLKMKQYQNVNNLINNALLNFCNWSELFGQPFQNVHLPELCAHRN
jgi:hypothetical protein